MHQLLSFSVRKMSATLGFQSILIMALADFIVSEQHCPFPGLPANGGAIGPQSKALEWKDQRHFKVGDRIDYFCDPQWQIPIVQQVNITCQADGTWSGPVARCGKFP